MNSVSINHDLLFIGFSNSDAGFRSKENWQTHLLWAKVVEGERVVQKIVAVRRLPLLGGLGHARFEVMIPGDIGRYKRLDFNFDFCWSRV